jgi:hypothetical protein
VIGPCRRSPHGGAPRCSTYAKPPSFRGRRQDSEPVRVQAFSPEAAVKGLDIRIVGGLARLREVEREAAHAGPQVEGAGDQLGALVDPDRTRIAGFGRKLTPTSKSLAAASLFEAQVGNDLLQLRVPVLEPRAASAVKSRLLG